MHDMILSYFFIYTYRIYSNHTRHKNSPFQNQTTLKRAIMTFCLKNKHHLSTDRVLSIANSRSRVIIKNELIRVVMPIL